MPPNTGNKKKKKGHAPAHQNKFAFQHNPKSKMTAKIMASPNIHVCRRCHDKIEWRKQYRKYKPRTQPGTCNGCSKRNVKAAYHTICESCTRHCVKARELIDAKIAEETPETPEGETHSQSSSTAGTPKLRVCAVCVKDLALPDPEDDQEDNDLVDNMGRIRLRERKAMERQIEREAKEARKTSKQSKYTDDETGQNPAGSESESNDDKYDGSDNHGGDDDEEEDPFLKAVGGADKLLTGKAYQEKLLAEQR